MIQNKVQALVLLHTLHAAIYLVIFPLDLMYKIGWNLYSNCIDFFLHNTNI